MIDLEYPSSVCGLISSRLRFTMAPLILPIKPMEIPSGIAQPASTIHLDTSCFQFCAEDISCIFGSFASLAVCSTCANITSSVEKTWDGTGRYELSLPNGPHISGIGGQINTSVTDISASLRSIEASVVQFSALYSRQVNNSDDALAWECALYYCISNYNVSVRDGSFLQTVQETWRNDSATYMQSGDLIYDPPESVINITADRSEFSVQNLAAKALNSFMTDTFTGSGRVKSPTDSAFSSDVIHALYEANDIPVRINNLAVSMSNNIRQQKDSGSNPFTGTPYRSETFIHVRWAWFSYPIALFIMFILCLFATIRQTSHSQVNAWKSSNLALLFHGQSLDLNDRDHSPINTLSQMVQRTSVLKAELVQTESGVWRLVTR